MMQFNKAENSTENKWTDELSTINYEINFNELSIRTLDTLLHLRLPGRVWYTWDWITELQHWHATWIILQSRDSVFQETTITICFRFSEPHHSMT